MEYTPIYFEIKNATASEAHLGSKLQIPVEISWNFVTFKIFRTIFLVWNVKINNALSSFCTEQKQHKTF